MSVVALEYSRETGGWRRRALRALATLTVLAGGWAAWRYGPVITEIAQDVYWQRKCHAYRAPDRLLVYEDDRAAALALLNSGEGYGQVHVGHVRTTDPAWRAVGYLPPPLRSPRTRWVSNIFLGKLKSPNGTSYIGVIAAQLFAQSDGSRILQIYGPARKPSLVAKARVMGSTSMYLKLDSTDHLQIFAGRVDSGDPSRLSIRYVLNGQPCLINCVQQDGGMLALQTPDGPLAVRLHAGPTTLGQIGLATLATSQPVTWGYPTSRPTSPQS